MLPNIFGRLRHRMLPCWGGHWPLTLLALRALLLWLLECWRPSLLPPAAPVGL